MARSATRRPRKRTGDDVSFADSQNSIAWWKKRLRANHVSPRKSVTDSRTRHCVFLIPMGCMLELMESPVIPSEGRVDHTIRGFAAPTLEVRHLERTEKLLIEILGFEFVGEENNRRRLRGSGSNAVRGSRPRLIRRRLWPCRCWHGPSHCVSGGE